MKNPLWKILPLFLMFLWAYSANGQLITTFGGGTSPGSAGEGIPATAANLGNPHYGIFDKFGNYYYSDNTGCRIRKINTAGIVNTIAGNSLIGYGGDGGQATAAKLKFPGGLAFDGVGNLYIADHQNFRVRKVDISTGIITTVAGSGVAGDAGDGNLATSSAVMVFPADVLFDKRGNLYISDNTYHKIRKVNVSGVISTFAGTGVAAFGGDGGPATNADLWYPTSMATDDTGNVYVVDGMNKRVRKIDTFGIISTYAGNGTGVYAGDGMPATSAQVGPLGIAWHGNMLYITDTNLRVRKVDASGIISTVAGTGVWGYNGDNIPATAAQLTSLGGATVDSCGNLYFSDIYNYRIRKIVFNPTCASTTILNVTNASKASLTIYPNPTSTTLTLTSTPKINTLSITNSIGQIIHHQQYAGKEQIEINVAHLPQGIYTLKINGTHVRRFLKQ